MILVVVVAEDEPLIRMMIAQFLTDEGFKVWEVQHAAEALIVLDAEAPSVHVLFTDICMPGEMDGLALSHHVKAHWPWIGSLVTSAHAALTEAELPAGGRFLPKPYHHSQVIKHVREMCSAL